MGRILLDLETLSQAVDNGFTDTLSILIDLFKLAGKNRRYEYIEIPSQLGMILRRVLIKPKEVIDLISEILQMGFDRRERIRTIKYKGKDVKEKQVYYINNNFTGYSIYYDPRKYYFNIMCQHSSILGKAKTEIVQDIKNLFQCELGVEDKYIQNLDKTIKLCRIDFKRDHRYIDEQNLSLIKAIVEIAPDTIVGANYEKKDEKDEHPEIDNFDDIEYMKKFKSESNKTAEFVVYDKFLERLDKFDKGLITHEELEQYQRVIRFEVRIKNGKLNSLKSDKKWALDKDIDNYKEESVANELFNYYAEQVFFKEPFFRLDVAKRKIRDLDITPYKKKTFRELLNQINEKGYTRAKEEYKYPSSFNSHIKELRDLGINPLTFKETWTDGKGKRHKTTYTSIPNFIQKENCIIEDDYIIDSKYWELVRQNNSTKKVIDTS